MTVDQLRQFIAVAKHLNFSRGAEEMFLHQSTVSKNIAALEAEIREKLRAEMMAEMQKKTESETDKSAD